jgi:hypothetical protein
MKMTPSKMATILRRYDEAIEVAKLFVEQKYAGYRRGDIRIDSYGCVEEYVNSSCNCHPEYEWIQRGTAEEFKIWLQSRP